MFFSIIAVFSAVFPYFQAQRAKGARWTKFYAPAMLICLALPLSLMDGLFRPILAGLAVLISIFLFVRALQSDPGAT